VLQAQRKTTFRRLPPSPLRIRQKRVSDEMLPCIEAHRLDEASWVLKEGRLGRSWVKVAFQMTAWSLSLAEAPIIICPAFATIQVYAYSAYVSRQHV
jgi:hypothetical protein